MVDLGILIHDGNRIIDSNATFCEKSGYPLSELLDSSPLDLVAPEFQETVRQKCHSTEDSSYVTMGVTKDGSSVLVEVAAKTVNYQGGMIRIAVISEAAEAESQQLDEDCVRNLVHGLRAPLNNLQMALQMMRLAPSLELQQRYYELAVSECDREVEFINNFLDLVKIQSGSYELTLELIDLNSWLPELLQPFELRIRSLGQRLTLQIAPDLSPLFTDPFLLRRILEELVVNACKYTNSGGEIQLQIQSENGGVELIVRNSKQIPPDRLPYIFNRFYRYRSEESPDLGGSGLGLSVVREMVSALEGQISVTSQDGWTSFTVWLPNR
ncbi:MAG: PAS domain-containing sensor histidine kinase [Leptolyngbyaceae cyanobacterium HOT.MB2.61]|jgi:PAS domain S-box-containing protein|nr:PAS domain-containing sensor histidine kinase [Leptolyngbyaceae cyanobacterium HOT.MB2.61]